MSTSPSFILPHGWRFPSATRSSFLNVFFRLFRSGATLGLRAFSRTHIRKAGLKRAVGFVLQPVENWSRYPELTSVLELFPATSEPDLILDVGSPKGLGLCLARERAGHFVLTDVWDVAVREVEELARIAAVEGRSTVELAVADALRLDQAESSVDVVYSVSVLEHISARDGLERALNEFARVLKPGGTCLVTLPIRTRFEDEYLDSPVYSQQETKDGKVFFSHYYDKATISAAVIRARVFGLELDAARVVYWREKWLPLRLWRKVPQKIRGLLGIVNLALSPWSFRHSEGLPERDFEGAGDVILRWRKA